MKRILCYLFGHKWRYNFPNMPSKVICARCHSKYKFDLRQMEWYPTDTFGDEKRSDSELIKKWFKTTR